MSENHQLAIKNMVEYDSIIYILNEEENTAGVFGCKVNCDEILIPRSIKKESKEYYITSILENAFKRSQIKIIQFASDSKLQIIEKSSFSYSQIKRITIPSTVTTIGESAFSFCKHLEQIDISSDSKLHTIDKDAFSFINIERIKIPSSVKSIGEEAFSNCNKLHQFEISNNSNLQTIGKDVFIGTLINSITIPSKLIDLKEGWCNNTPYLNKIEVSPNNPRYCNFDEKMIIGKTNIDQNDYDCLIFCVRYIHHIKIPNFIKHICSNSFDECQLESIEIQSGSQLQTIDKSAFMKSTIESITIPSQLIDLKERWCYGTSKLKKIDVSPENKKYSCYEDKMIIGKTNIDQSNFDCLVLCVRNVEHIKIPDFIEHICSCSFNYCKQLQQIDISYDSKLQTIDEFAFGNSAIKSIIIPPSVTLIGKCAFSDCNQLKKIEISNNSKLQKIDEGAFCFSTIESITIPSSITLIGELAFCYCFRLQIIEINNPKMILMCRSAFELYGNSLVMISNI